ncbi:MAG: hypothetical protein JNG88_00080 [Phycisphaerales bacterium]|nr:hypothetical protein [Phycisphaerales bacterium]
MMPLPRDLPQALRHIAESAAREGGRVAREAFGSDLNVERKADGSEVTPADLAAQTAVIRHIRTVRPHDCFLTEEETADSSLSTADPGAIWWIIDPIDGTRNFIRGVPLFACSVAACSSSSAIAGAIYWVSQDTMYSAALGHGATCNARALLPLDAGRARDGRSGRPVVGVPSSISDEIRDTALRWIDNGVVRNLGSTALHLALVAAGGMDAALCSDSKLWDIAAGWVLITELRGRIHHPSGGAIFPREISLYDRSCTPCVAIRDERVAARLQN